MIIDPPEKRKDYYVSRVSHKKNQSFTLKITDARIAGIHEIENDGGYIIKLWIPACAASSVKDIDATAIETSRRNNQEWFHNALPDDKITDYFRPSITDQGICTVLVSTTKIPRLITWCGEDIDDFAGIVKMNMKTIRAMSCSCTLEVQGIYFYPKKFGVRWIVRSIEFFDPSSVDDSDTDIDLDKDEIEAFWRSELDDVCNLIDEDIVKLYEKVEILTEFKRTLGALLQAAKEQPDCTSRWEKNLNALKEEIFQYKRGRL